MPGFDVFKPKETDDEISTPPTLGSFLKGLVTGESYPEELKIYNQKFKERLEAHPEEAKIAKFLIFPAWETIQSVKSGIVSRIKKEPEGEAWKDRSIREIPEVDKILTSELYIDTFKNILRAGAKLSFSASNSLLYNIPKDIKSSLYKGIDNLTPDQIANFTEGAADLLALGALEGGIGLFEKYVVKKPLLSGKTTLAPELRLEGKPYSEEQLKSIKKVHNTINDLAQQGIDNPFGYTVRNRKKFNITPQEFNLWQGATSEAPEIRFGAGLPVPRRVSYPAEGGYAMGDLIKTEAGFGIIKTLSGQTIKAPLDKIIEQEVAEEPIKKIEKPKTQKDLFAPEPIPLKEAKAPVIEDLKGEKGKKIDIFKENWWEQDTKTLADNLTDKQVGQLEGFTAREGYSDIDEINRALKVADIQESRGNIARATFIRDTVKNRVNFRNTDIATLKEKFPEMSDEQISNLAKNNEKANIEMNKLLTPSPKEGKGFAKLKPQEPIDIAKEIPDLATLKEVRAKELENIKTMKFPIEDAYFHDEPVRILGPADLFSPYKEAAKGKVDYTQLLVENDERGQFITFSTQLKVNGKYLQTPTPSHIKLPKTKFEEMLEKQTKEQKLTPYDTPEIIETRKKAFAIPETINIDTPEREAMRQEWIQRAYGTGAKNKNKQADIILGIPASGKNKQVAIPIAKQQGSLIIDSDIIKDLTPEMKKYGGIAAQAVHKETATAIGKVIKQAIANGDNIVLTLTGKNYQNIKNIIEWFNKNGYEVYLHGVDLPVDKAVDRAMRRYFEEGGRWVDPQYIVNDVSLTGIQNYDKLKMEKGVEGYVKYSTDVPKGAEAKIIEIKGPRRDRGDSDLARLRGDREGKEAPQEVTPLEEKIPKGYFKMPDGSIAADTPSNRQLAERQAKEEAPLSNPIQNATITWQWEEGSITPIDNIIMNTLWTEESMKGDYYKALETQREVERKILAGKSFEKQRVSLNNWRDKDPIGVTPNLYLYVTYLIQKGKKVPDDLQGILSDLVADRQNGTVDFNPETKKYEIASEDFELTKEQISFYSKIKDYHELSFDTSESIAKNKVVFFETPSPNNTKIRNFAKSLDSYDDGNSLIQLANGQKKEIETRLLRVPNYDKLKKNEKKIYDAIEKGEVISDKDIVISAPEPRPRKPKAKTLGRIVAEGGGIDPKKAEAAGYNISEDFKQFGLNYVLKEGGPGIDDRATELISTGDLIPEDPERPADSLLHALQRKEMAATTVDIERDLDRENLKEWRKMQGDPEEKLALMKSKLEEKLVLLKQKYEGKLELEREKALLKLRNLHEKVRIGKDVAADEARHRVKLSRILRTKERTELLNEIGQRLSHKALNPSHFKNIMLKEFGVISPMGLSNRDLRRLIKVMEERKAELSVPIYPSEEKIIGTAEKEEGKFPIPGFKTINNLRRFGTSGQILADKIEYYEKNSNQHAGYGINNIRKITELIGGVKKWPEFVDVIRGEIEPRTPQEQEALAIYKTTMDFYANKAQTLELEVRDEAGFLRKFRPRENYWPLKYNISDLQSEEYKKKAIEHIARQNNITPARATELYETFRNDLKSAQFGHLEKAREIELPDYRRDVEVAIEYIIGASHRLSWVEQFGKDTFIGIGKGFEPEKVVEIVGRMPDKVTFMGKEEYPRKIAREVIKRIGDRKVRSALERLGQNLRTIQAAKLAFSAIPNFFQWFTNTWPKVGTKNMITAVWQRLSKEGREFAEISGAIGSHRAMELAEIKRSGILGKIAEIYLRIILFSGTERNNRILTALAGRAYVKGIAQKLMASQGSGIKAAWYKWRTPYFENELRKMFINPDDLLKNGMLSEQNLKDAAYSISLITQFSARPGYIPSTWSGEMGRFLTQFKNFAYNQSSLLWNEALKPFIDFVNSKGRRGNLNIFMYLIAIPMAGAVVKTVRDKIYRREVLEEDIPLYMKMLTWAASAGGFGLAFDALFAVQNEEKGVYSFLGGPTMSDIVYTMTSLYRTGKEAIEGDKEKAIYELYNLASSYSPMFKVGLRLANKSLGDIARMGQMRQLVIDIRKRYTDYMIKGEEGKAFSLWDNLVNKYGDEYLQNYGKMLLPPTYKEIFKQEIKRETPILERKQKMMPGRSIKGFEAFKPQEETAKKGFAIFAH